MSIDPVSGAPWGSKAQQEHSKSLHDAPKLTWREYLLSFLFVPFFWAVFFAIKGLFSAALVAIFAFPHIIAAHYSLIGAIIAVIIGGILLFLFGFRKPRLFAVIEGSISIIAAAYALLALPGGGLQALLAVFGGMAGVAHGILWFRKKLS